MKWMFDGWLKLKHLEGLHRSIKNVNRAVVVERSRALISWCSGHAQNRGFKSGSFLNVFLFRECLDKSNKLWFSVGRSTVCNYLSLCNIRDCSTLLRVKEIFLKNFSIFAKSEAVFTVSRQRKCRPQGKEKCQKKNVNHLLSE